MGPHALGDLGRVPNHVREPNPTIRRTRQEHARTGGDRTFDPFRPDQDGTPITSSDLTGNLAVLSDGGTCPASDRKSQVECGIFVMGNLIGGTLAHEIGHSLGLANPYADGFHDAGDQPNRLMDAGGDRPFLERAVLQGQGPGVFCDDEYAYLRQIMPTNTPPDNTQRPGCF